MGYTYKNNTVTFQVTGDLALFAEPLTRTSGEKFTYPVPTYEALKGICRNIYWKPTIDWFIDEVRVMNPIRTETRVAMLRQPDGKKDIAHYTYLKDVKYQVQAHFEWNLHQVNMVEDRIEKKHLEIMERWIKRGGRGRTYLGTSECWADVEPCDYGYGEGYYDHSGDLSFGLMEHGFTYSDQAFSKETEGMLTVNFWRPVMENGYIKFPRPEECIHHPVHPFHSIIFESKK